MLKVNLALFCKYFFPLVIVTLMYMYKSSNSQIVKHFSLSQQINFKKNRQKFTCKVVIPGPYYT